MSRCSSTERIVEEARRLGYPSELAREAIRALPRGSPLRNWSLNDPRSHSVIHLTCSGLLAVRVGQDRLEPSHASPRTERWRRTRGSKRSARSHAAESG